MKIVLIYPLLSRARSLVDENKQYWPPLGLAYIAAVLEKSGHKVKIVDRDALLHKYAMSFERTDEETLAVIGRENADMVGFSATTPNVGDVLTFSSKIKKSFPGVKIVLGGPHSSGEPEYTLNLTNDIDALCRGEGESTMLDLASGKALGEIPGVSFKSGKTIVHNAERPLINNIDDLPMPAHHLLDMEFYLRPSRFTSRNLSLRTTSIFTARGCPYRCNFCAGPLIFSGKVRFHSSQRVLEEMERLITDYGIEALYFAEDMFLSDKRRANEILELFIRKGINKKIRWFAQAKVNVIDKELLVLMKRAGCVGIEYGFESGSQEILNRMNKKSRVEDNVKAAKLTEKVGLRYQANIIAGYPGETKEDFEMTIAFLKKIRPSNIGFNQFMALPGTPEYVRLKRTGDISYDWENVGNPEGGKNYTAMTDRDFQKVYAKARILVILPLNLANFIRYNIKDPIRFIYLVLTQFRGILIKTVRSDLKKMLR
ncbi:MAG: radical SAM protein [Candidatus Omnitrophica bacterium]|nr:radical SAM protein [Candidatus Omnitrophota bacterium]MDD5435936.1 radical SAM protein [Candidatus Omnitrophota bacterium]